MPTFIEKQEYIITSLGELVEQKTSDSFVMGIEVFESNGLHFLQLLFSGLLSLPAYDIALRKLGAVILKFSVSAVIIVDMSEAYFSSDTVHLNLLEIPDTISASLQTMASLELICAVEGINTSEAIKTITSLGARAAGRNLHWCKNKEEAISQIVQLKTS